MHSYLQKHYKLAYPYAKAILAEAQQYKQEDIWQEMLNVAAQIIELGNKKKIFIDPRLTIAIKISFFAEINQHFPPFRGLLQVLAERKKIILFPAIASLYEQLIRRARKILTAKVVAAYALTVAEQKRLVAVLARRYNHKIILENCIDDTLIGGMIVYVNDQVFDGSLRELVHRLHKVCSKKN